MSSNAIHSDESLAARCPEISAEVGFLSLGYGWLRCAPGVLGAFTNVLLLIYTSTQYSGWTATEKVGAVQMFFSRRIFQQIMALC